MLLWGPGLFWTAMLMAGEDEPEDRDPNEVLSLEPNSFVYQPQAL